MSDNIDYKRLLEICMLEWFSSEGCCWDGSYFNEELGYKELSKDEKEVVKELCDTIRSKCNE